MAARAPLAAFSHDVITDLTVLSMRMQRLRRAATTGAVTPESLAEEVAEAELVIAAVASRIGAFLQDHENAPPP